MESKHRSESRIEIVPLLLSPLVPRRRSGGGYVFSLYTAPSRDLANYFNWGSPFPVRKGGFIYCPERMPVRADFEVSVQRGAFYF